MNAVPQDKAFADAVKVEGMKIPTDASASCWVALGQQKVV